MVAISTRMAIVGAGNMGEALLKGWLAKGVVQPEDVSVAEVLPQRRTYIANTYQVDVHANIEQAVQGAQVVVIVVKPNQATQVLPEIKAALDPKALVISIVTGLSLQQLQKELGRQIAVLRAMPNTPCLVGASASGLSPGRNVTPEQEALALELFQAVGIAFILDEHLLDAVTGLSGSGPAYVYLIIEAMAAGGVHAGLPANVAKALAAQTVLGAASMVLNGNEHPAVLREKVTTPAGTTASGLLVMEEAGVRAALMQAVLSATQRARELRECS